MTTDTVDAGPSQTSHLNFLSITTEEGKTYDLFEDISFEIFCFVPLMDWHLLRAVSRSWHAAVQRFAASQDYFGRLPMLNLVSHVLLYYDQQKSINSVFQYVVKMLPNATRIQFPMVRHNGLFVTEYHNMFNHLLDNVELLRRRDCPLDIRCFVSDLSVFTECWETVISRLLIAASPTGFVEDDSSCQLYPNLTFVNCENCGVDLLFGSSVAVDLKMPASHEASRELVAQNMLNSLQHRLQFKYFPNVTLCNQPPDEIYDEESDEIIYESYGEDFCIPIASNPPPPHDDDSISEYLDYLIREQRLSNLEANALVQQLMFSHATQLEIFRDRDVLPAASLLESPMNYTSLSGSVDQQYAFSVVKLLFQSYGQQCSYAYKELLDRLIERCDKQELLALLRDERTMDDPSSYWFRSQYWQYSVVLSYSDLEIVNVLVDILIRRGIGFLHLEQMFACLQLIVQKNRRVGQFPALKSTIQAFFQTSENISNLGEVLASYFSSVVKRIGILEMEELWAPQGSDFWFRKQVKKVFTVPPFVAALIQRYEGNSDMQAKVLAKALRKGLKKGSKRTIIMWEKFLTIKSIPFDVKKTVFQRLDNRKAILCFVQACPQREHALLIKAKNPLADGQDAIEAAQARGDQQLAQELKKHYNRAPRSLEKKRKRDEQEAIAAALCADNESAGAEAVDEVAEEAETSQGVAKIPK